jgi:hypothetical protein
VAFVVAFGSAAVSGGAAWRMVVSGLDVVMVNFSLRGNHRGQDMDHSGWEDKQANCDRERRWEGDDRTIGRRGVMAGFDI